MQKLHVSLTHDTFICLNKSLFFSKYYLNCNDATLYDVMHVLYFCVITTRWRHWIYAHHPSHCLSSMICVGLDEEAGSYCLCNTTHILINKYIYSDIYFRSYCFHTAYPVQAEHVWSILYLEQKPNKSLWESVTFELFDSPQPTPGRSCMTLVAKHKPKEISLCCCSSCSFSCTEAKPVTKLQTFLNKSW